MQACHPSETYFTMTPSKPFVALSPMHRELALENFKVSDVNPPRHRLTLKNNSIIICAVRLMPRTQCIIFGEVTHYSQCTYHDLVQIKCFSRSYFNRIIFYFKQLHQLHHLIFGIFASSFLKITIQADNKLVQ